MVNHSDDSTAMEFESQIMSESGSKQLSTFLSVLQRVIADNAALAIGSAVDGDSALAERGQDVESGLKHVNSKLIKELIEKHQRLVRSKLNEGALDERIEGVSSFLITGVMESEIAPTKTPNVDELVENSKKFLKEVFSQYTLIDILKKADGYLEKHNLLPTQFDENQRSAYHHDESSPYNREADGTIETDYRIMSGILAPIIADRLISEDISLVKPTLIDGIELGLMETGKEKIREKEQEGKRLEAKAAKQRRERDEYAVMDTRIIAADAVRLPKQPDTTDNELPVISTPNAVKKIIDEVGLLADGTANKAGEASVLHHAVQVAEGRLNEWIAEDTSRYEAAQRVADVLLSEGNLRSVGDVLDIKSIRSNIKGVDNSALMSLFNDKNTGELIELLLSDPETIILFAPVLERSNPDAERFVRQIIKSSNNSGKFLKSPTPLTEEDRKIVLMDIENFEPMRDALQRALTSPATGQGNGAANPSRKSATR